MKKPAASRKQAAGINRFDGKDPILRCLHGKKIQSFSETDFVFDFMILVMLNFGQDLQDKQDL